MYHLVGKVQMVVIRFYKIVSGSKSWQVVAKVNGCDPVTCTNYQHWPAEILIKHQMPLCHLRLYECSPWETSNQYLIALTDTFQWKKNIQDNSSELESKYNQVPLINWTLCFVCVVKLIISAQKEFPVQNLDGMSQSWVAQQNQRAHRQPAWPPHQLNLIPSGLL